MAQNSSEDENIVHVRGYRIHFSIATFLRLLLFVGSFSIICFLISNSTNITSRIVLTVTAVLIALTAIVFHSPTIIYFSRDFIKVKYGFLPIIRKRKTKDLIKVSLEFSESLSNDEGSTFNYLVLTFDKAWNIKIMTDQLTRKEKEQITTKLSYLRYKFSNE